MLAQRTPHVSGPSGMRRGWIAVVALACSACAPMQWARQGATPDELAADTRRCEQQAWQEANYYFLGYRPFGPWLYRDAWSGPFLHPAGPFYDPFYDRTMEEQRLMRAKGYELAPVSR